MSNSDDKRLFLLDAFALIYRAYFALNSSSKGTKGFHNSKGFNTSTVYGFTNTLLDLMQKEHPTHIAVVFDAPGITDRAAEHDFYKANREAMPEDIRDSIPVIKELIKAFDIPILEEPGYEADDLIGTIAKKAEKDGYKVYMVTPDKDFAQLVSDNIFIFKPAYKGNGFDTLGLPEVKAKWEVERPEQVIDILGMWGDAVDNIPGIPGIGEKTAKKFIAAYGSMEGLYEHTDELKGKQKENVENNKDQAFISKQLATIIIDAPVEVDEEALIITKPDEEKLKALFAELEFRTIGKRVFGDEFSVNQQVTEGQMDLFATAASNITPNVAQEAIATEGGKNIENTKHEYQLADTADKRSQLIKTLSAQKSICFDTETTGIDANNCELVGMSFSVEVGKAWYVPVPADQQEAQALVDEFKPLLENADIEKIGQNIKYDILVLKWYGVQVQGAIFDTMLAHYILDPESRHSMDRLAEDYLGYSTVSIETLIGKKGKNQGSMRDVPVEQIKEYAAEDADITLQLKEKFAPLIKANKQEKLFNDIENPLVYTLADMEYEGVLIDRDFLADYSKELGSEILTLRDNIFKEAGTEFNIDSPKQLSQVLFQKMEIPYKGKKTKTGQYSTNEDTLSKLVGEHEIAQYLLDYRELVKLKNTYVDKLPDEINPKTGRVHTSFSQAIAATGRLSSNNPNLQNIPIRTERGRRIRKAFIPRDENYLLLSADYSQIELRLAAAMSGDETMLDAFVHHKDIHSITASRVYKIPLEEVTSDQRRNAKAVNFGILYGTTAYGLSQNIGIPRTEAAELIENYFKEFSGLKSFMDEAIAKARKTGYAETLMGRRRYLHDINSSNNIVKNAAERNAINAPLQGTAADMIKIAMNRIHSEMKKQKMQSKMTLQVHDELVFDVHKDEIDTLKPMVEDLMQNAIKLSVPIEVESGTGKNWLEAH